MVSTIVIKMMLFYAITSIGTIIDAWFISKGKTYFLFINSFIVNVVYYGTMYALFKNEIFEVRLDFIILLFGVGMVVHLIVSVAEYMLCIRKMNAASAKNRDIS